MGQIVYQALVWLLLVQGCFASNSTSHTLVSSLVSDTPCAGYGDLMVTIGEIGGEDFYDEIDGEISGEILCGMDKSYQSLMAIEAPTFQYQAAKKNVMYTIMIFHTGRPVCRTNLNYMIANIMGDGFANADTSNEDIFSFYNRPFIPDTQQTDVKLRYFMYAFEQQYPLEGIAFSSSSLCHFDADKFVRGHDLTPVAANMFTTQQ